LLDCWVAGLLACALSTEYDLQTLDIIIIADFFLSFCDLAYIGRNFPGVPLFPDLTKLSVTGPVLDVYGRPQTIPFNNLFVAGTSCKDFSMLKGQERLDIEDKGTSGETFLAAVEFLDKYQPPVSIFENVDGAP